MARRNTWLTLFGILLFLLGGWIAFYAVFWPPVKIGSPFGWIFMILGILCMIWGETPRE